MTIRDNKEYIRVLVDSYYTTITGWGVLLNYLRNPVSISFVAKDAAGRTVVDQSTPIMLQSVTSRPLDCNLRLYRLTCLTFLLAGNEGLKEKVDTTNMGYIGTAIRMHSFIPS